MSLLIVRIRIFIYFYLLLASQDNGEQYNVSELEKLKLALSRSEEDKRILEQNLNEVGGSSNHFNFYELKICSIKVHRFFFFSFKNISLFYTFIYFSVTKLYKR